MNENNVPGKCYFNNINHLHVSVHHSMFHVIRGEPMNSKSPPSLANTYIKATI